MGINSKYLVIQRGFVLAICLISGPWLHAEIRPEKIRVANSTKNLSYLRDGLITGGDGQMDDVTIKEIRWASNRGFERIVIDLEGNRNGEPVAIQRPPYYQVAVNPDEKRLIFSVSGKTKLNFDPKKVISAFKRSSLIQRVVLLPPLEGVPWTFVFELKEEAPVEVFELAQPVRVILDIQQKKN
jgi:hypothetical protein